MCIYAACSDAFLDSDNENKQINETDKYNSMK